jgi:hypothetical protein
VLGCVWEGAEVFSFSHIATMLGNVAQPGRVYHFRLLWQGCGEDFYS